MPADGSEPVGEAAAVRWEIDSPVGAYSLAPDVEVVEGELLLSWLEQTASESGQIHHQLLVARLQPTGWSTPAWVAAGDDFFANWADTPRLTAAADGTLFAHWLAKTDAETYAYSIFLASSTDGGETWSTLGTLNRDATPTEHGFVSYVPESDGIRAFWLDGRLMEDGGDMTLRTTTVHAGVGAGTDEILDERVCECCATAAAVAAGGPVVVFRDRSPEEIRDIGIVRRQGTVWSPSTRIAADDWRIEGCPVNGPAVAARQEQVVVVWYTAGGDGPAVRLAISADGGASFGPPATVDEGRPLGRVDIVDDGADGFLVSWLEGGAGDAEIRLRRVSAAGDLGPAVVATRTSPSRASGFPRLARLDDQLFLVWVDSNGSDRSRVRILQMPIAAIR